MEKEIHCRTCGAMLADNAKFCSGCGKAVTPTQAQVVIEETAKNKKQELGKVLFWAGVVIGWVFLIGIVVGGSAFGPLALVALPLLLAGMFLSNSR